MSFKAKMWVRGIPRVLGDRVSPTAKLVMFALADRHNQETGRCDPSMETIADDLGVSVRAVRDGIRALEKAKVIATVHRVQRTGRGKKNLSNRYRFLPFWSAADIAGGIRQDLPTNQEGRRLAQPTPRPTAFNDLVGLVEDPLGEEDVQADADQGVPSFEIERED